MLLYERLLEGIYHETRDASSLGVASWHSHFHRLPWRHAQGQQALEAACKVGVQVGVDRESEVHATNLQEGTRAGIETSESHRELGETQRKRFKQHMRKRARGRGSGVHERK